MCQFGCTFKESQSELNLTYTAINRKLLIVNKLASGGENRNQLRGLAYYPLDPRLETYYWVRPSRPR